MIYEAIFHVLFEFTLAVGDDLQKSCRSTSQHMFTVLPPYTVKLCTVRLHHMWLTATDVARSVCLLVTDCELYKNGRTDRHAVCVVDLSQWRIQDFCKGVRQLVPLECPKPLHALAPSDP